jgi:hypothetical protein
MLNILVRTTLSKTNLIVKNGSYVNSVVLCKKYSTGENKTISKQAQLDVSNCSHLLEAHNPDVFKLMDRYMIVKEDFLSEQEETSLLGEIEPYMKRLRYEFDHWDDVCYKQSIIKNQPNPFSLSIR